MRQLRRLRLCGGTLAQSFIESCNATFARLGYELGNDFVPRMNECGVGSDVHRSRRRSTSTPARSGASARPRASDDKPRFALAGIGQDDVFTTPLQMALVAAGIGNGGVIMEPHVAKQITNADGKVIQTIESEAVEDLHATRRPRRRSPSMMVEVVERGTGDARRRSDNVTVAARRGTAQTGVEGQAPHAWFIAFAPADAPRYAVAVIVENGGDYGSERPAARSRRRSPGRCSSNIVGAAMTARARTLAP